MKEILVVNPAKKGGKKKRKKTTKTKGKKNMATKKKGKKGKKKNPSKAIQRARATFMGMNFNSVIRNMPAMQLGMFAAKFAAKRFGEENPASETDPGSWNWASYMKGGLGVVVAGAVAQNVRRGAGQKVLEGGLNYLLFKIIQNELITQSEWATNWLGEDDDVYIDEYGTPYMMGEYDEAIPVDERHRLPEAGDFADELSPPGRLGDVLVPPGRLGETSDPWRKAFTRR